MRRVGKFYSRIARIHQATLVDLCMKMQFRHYGPAAPLPSSPLATLPVERIWNATPFWCSLCKEPFNSWNEHRGKRDHICLEMFFDAIDSQPRCWNPLNVLIDLERRGWHSMDKTEAAVAEACVSHCSSTHVSSLYSSCLTYVDRTTEHPRRVQLFALLQFLRNQGVLKFGKELKVQAVNPADSQAMAQINGMLALFKELHVPMMYLFPSVDQKILSGLTQMVASSYNLETAFELCNMLHLAHPSLLGAAGSEVSYVVKANVVRATLGQLRWSVEPESLASPPSVSHPGREYLETVCSITMRMLLCEIIFCRVSEYVCRVEPVWRDLQSKATRSRGEVKPSGKTHGLTCLSNASQHNTVRLCPANSNEGMLQFVNYSFHDPRFGMHLKQNPRQPVKKEVRYFK